jgi:D-3-phosphoglycerate dehydrogenase
MSKKILSTINVDGTLNKIIRPEMQKLREEIAAIEQEGYEFFWKSLADTNDEEQIIAVAKGYHYVIAGGETWNERVLTALSPELKVLVRFGAGYDKVDLAAASRLGIAVCNTPGANAISVAEHALALMIALVRDITLMDDNVRKGDWSRRIAPGITGKTIGIYGFGAIGQHLAHLLSGFDCTILASDPYFDSRQGEFLHVKRVSPNELFAKADILSIHMPLTDETKGSINRSLFEKMKKDAYIVNTSRGKVICEEDLISALQDGTIAGAGLDVFFNEPLDEANPLLSLRNVVLSPHAASSAEEGFCRCFQASLDCIRSYDSVGRIASILNPDYAR